MSNEVRKHKRKGVNIPESVRKTGLTGLGIYAYLLAASAIHEQLGNLTSPISTILSRASESINKSEIGHYGLGNPMRFVNDVVSQVVQLDLSRPELINFIDALLLGVPLVAVGSLGLGGIIKSLSKNEARLFGEEPIKDNAVPSHVIITPTTKALEDMVASGHASGRLKNSKKSEVVGIHLDQGIPLQSLNNNKIGHHFAAEIQDLIGLPEDAEKKDYTPPLVHESGLDRASEITINCVPENFSLFYGSENRPVFGPKTIMEILGKVKVKGKIINIILPKEIKREGIRTVQEGLIQWQKWLSERSVNFELNIVTPEDEFIGLVRGRASEIVPKKDSDGFRVLVLGQQTLDQNAASLELPTNRPRRKYRPLPGEMNFLLSCLLEDRGPTGDANRILAEGVLISEYGDLKADAELSRQIANGDLIILTAQSDGELMIVTEKLVKAHGILRGKMIVIADGEKTAEFLERQFKVDTFVASRAINEAFS